MIGCEFGTKVTDGGPSPMAAILSDPFLYKDNTICWSDARLGLGHPSTSFAVSLPWLVSDRRNCREMRLWW